MHLKHHLLTVIIALTLASFVQASFAEPYLSVTGYQITPPSGWIISKDGGHTDISFTGPRLHEATPIIDVDVFEHPVDTSAATLAQDVDTLIEGEKSAPSFTQISRDATTISGKPAISFVTTYRTTPDGPPLRFWHVYVTRGTQAFLITAGCLDSDTDTFKPTLDTAVQSFSFMSAKGVRFVSRYPYSLLPISDWTVYPGADDKDVRMNGPGGVGVASNLIVAVIDIPADYTAKAIFSERASLNKEFGVGPNGWKLLSQTLTKALGVPAVDTLLTKQGTTEKGKTLRILSHFIMVPHGKYLYTFIFTEVASRAKEQEPLFRQMLNSVQWDKE